MVKKKVKKKLKSVKKNNNLLYWILGIIIVVAVVGLVYSFSSGDRDVRLQTPSGGVTIPSEYWDLVESSTKCLKSRTESQVAADIKALAFYNCRWISDKGCTLEGSTQMGIDRTDWKKCIQDKQVCCRERMLTDSTPSVPCAKNPIEGRKYGCASAIGLQVGGLDGIRLSGKEACEDKWGKGSTKVDKKRTRCIGRYCCLRPLIASSAAGS